MIADIMTNKKIQSVIKELFIRGRKPNISLVLITQIMKINNRKELKNIAINHSTDIDYKDFIRSYRECTKEPSIFLTIDTTLSSSNSLRLRKKLFDTL